MLWTGSNKNNICVCVILKEIPVLGHISIKIFWSHAHFCGSNLNTKSTDTTIYAVSDTESKVHRDEPLGLKSLEGLATQTLTWTHSILVNGRFHCELPLSNHIQMLSAVTATVELDQWDESCISPAASAVAALILNTAGAKNRASFFSLYTDGLNSLQL